MANYKLILEYDGTDYYGFQKQPDLPTIQGVLEKSLERIAKLDSPLYASGRTDAGVHARGQVVNFHGSIKAPAERFPGAANAFLPLDIIIKGCEEVGEDFNARRSAIAREYVYHIYLGKYPSPFNRRFAHRYSGELNKEKMRQAIQWVRGEHDFAAFSRRGAGRSSMREVYEADILLGNEIMDIRVKANAFVWMMMRMLCGSLVEVGRGKWSVEHFSEVLASKDNSLSGPALPPNGLVLEKVYY
jgi:tRNA pseudouridine38-40 synthase